MRDEPKTALTFEERITAAFMHYVRGIAQQDIAIMMGGVNGGRVNRACLVIKEAALLPENKAAERIRAARLDREEGDVLPLVLRDTENG